MNIRLYSIIILFFILIWSFNAQAVGRWTSPDIIDANNTPLEIAGGLTFNQDVAFNTFIVLNAGPQDSLQVYNVDVNIRGCSLANQSNITDFDGPLFAIGHRVVGTASDTDPPNGIFYTSVIDNFRLKVIRSDDAGKTWTVDQVSPNQVYESSEIAVDPDNPSTVYAGACNQPNHTYDIYRQDSFGSNNFQLAWQIPNVDCALSDFTTRSTFNVFDNQYYTFYGRNVGGGQQELYIDRGNGAELIDTDVLRPGNSTNEVYNPTLIDTTGYILTTYYNRSENAVKVAGSISGQFTPIDVREVGPDPNFTTSFGISCFEEPPGTANILYPGGNHFQIDTLTKTTTQVNTNGNFQFPNGPISAHEACERSIWAAFCNPFAEDGRRAAYMDNSIGCGEFILTVPTVPTLSQWGLIAMAGILGIVGFMVIRRRKVTA